jgi:hypothetical protein
MLVPVVVLVALPLGVVTKPVSQGVTLQDDVPPGDVVRDLNQTFCQIIASDLPSECNCTDKMLGGVVNCSVRLLRSDEISLIADVAPCDDVAHIDLKVSERNHQINFTLAGIEAGQTVNEPIPGLSVDVPKIGDAGVDAMVKIDGGLEMLELKLGLDACAEIHDYKVCGGSLTSHLPFWVLHGSFHFSNFCKKAMARYAQEAVVLV